MICSREMKLVLKQLDSLVSRSEKSEELMGRIGTLISKLASLVTSASADGETPNPTKILQMHLKYILFNSEAIRGTWAANSVWSQITCLATTCMQAQYAP